MGVRKWINEKLRRKAPDQASFVAAALRTGDSLTGIDPSWLKAYSQIATVFACVRRKSHDKASVPIIVEVRSGADWQRVEPGNGRFGQIAAVLSNGNPEEGRVRLWTRFHQHFDLARKAYLLTEYGQGRMPLNVQRPKGQTPQELWVLQPDAVTTKVNSFGRRVAFEYRVNNQTVVLRPDEVFEHLAPSPTGMFDGASPLDAARLSAQVENILGLFDLKAIQKGNIKAFGLVGPENWNPNKAQRDEWEWEWEAKFCNGLLEKHPNFVRGTKPQAFEQTFDSAGLIELQRISREQICMAFGVPPALVGIHEQSVRANVEEQSPIYWEGTLIPELRLLEEDLNQIVLPRFAPAGEIRCRFDIDAVEAIQRMMEMRAAAMVGLAGGPVLTPNNARARLNLPPVVGGDTLRENSLTVPSGPEKMPAPVGRASEPPKKSRLKWIDLPERHDKRARAARDKADLEKATLADLTALFNAQEDRAIARLEHKTAKMNGSFRAKDVNPDDVIDVEFETAQAQAILLRIYSRVASARGPAALAEVGGDPGAFFIDAPEIVAFLEQNAYSMGTSITGTTVELLKQLIVQAVEQGQTPDQLARAIRDTFALRRSHAESIARTETNRSYNFTTRESWKQSEVVEQMEWLSAGDDKVRSYAAGDEFDHTMNDGDTAPLDGTFHISGEELAYPGDPAGSPGNTINCRCTILPVVNDSPGKRYRVTNRLRKWLDGSERPLTHSGKGKQREGRG